MITFKNKNIAKSCRRLSSLTRRKRLPEPRLLCPPTGGRARPSLASF